MELNILSFMSKKSLLFIVTLFYSVFSFAQGEMNIDEKIESAFGPVSKAVTSVVFYSIPVFNTGKSIPVVIILLLFGALFFTLYNKFANILSLIHI